jgi:hypothetical protein
MVAPDTMPEDELAGLGIELLGLYPQIKSKDVRGVRGYGSIE